jgi:hypothetical protein
VKMETDPLFRDRVPEAAAVQLAVVLAWIAECELATLEYYRCTKSAPRSQLRRHESICADLVKHCRELNIRPSGLYGKPCPRLAELLTPLRRGG